MAAPLLSTKLFIPPTAKSLVLRPRLLEKLDESLQPGCRLTLVSAPAGFGKTTLVSTWVGGHGKAERPHASNVAWLSLDDGDNDLVIFWTYAINALQTQPKGIGKQALTLLQAPQSPDPEKILPLLVNDMVKLPGDLILVLDDYHLIRTSAIHQSLSFLIDHAPPHFHVLILSRTDPPLSLALLRSRGQLLEIRQADLRFTNEETQAYLNDQMKLSLPDGDVDTLNTKTEGWAAGIQMASISLQGMKDPSRFVQTFSGSNRHILDYLTDEILDRQPREVQTFLLYTSVLEKLSAGLCDAVVRGQGDSREILEQLERANLFLLPLDQERKWYRYHHLFAEILRLKLDRNLPEMVPVLQKNAAGWFEANSMFQEAVSFLHSAGDEIDLARLIEQNTPQLIREGYVTALRKWVHLLPEERIINRPWLCILMASWHLNQMELAEAEHWLDSAERLIQGTDLDESTSEMLGTSYAMRTEILQSRGNYSGAIETAQKTLALLDPSNFNTRGSVYYSLGRSYYATGDLDDADRIWSEFLRISTQAKIYNMYAPITGILCTILSIKGKLQEVLSILRQAIDYMVANEIERFFISGNPYHGLGLMLYQVNDLESAERLIAEGLKQNRRWGNPNAISVSLSYRVQLQIALGNLEAAGIDLQELDRIEKTFTPYFDVRSIFLACRVRYQLAKGNLPSAVNLVQKNGLRSDDPLTFQNELDHITLSRVLLAQGNFEEAESLLHRLAEAAKTGGRFGRLIEILNLRAIALNALGRSSEALQALESSLNLAEPEGYMRVFIDLQEPMARLLSLAVQKGVHPGYARQLLAAFPDSAAQAASAMDIQKNNLALIESLSRREIEVLQLIATDLANKEIGQRLGISLSTVKYHTTGIYTKLGVNRRTQAIVKARELGLLR